MAEYDFSVRPGEGPLVRQQKRAEFRSSLDYEARLSHTEKSELVELAENLIAAETALSTKLSAINGAGIVRFYHELLEGADKSVELTHDEKRKLWRIGRAIFEKWPESYDNKQEALWFMR